MSTLDNSMPSPGPVDHSRCDFGGKQVRCDRCGREFVCSPSDDLYCTDDGDHCCEGCLLVGYPQPLIILDPTDLDATDLARHGHAEEPDISPGGDAR